MWPARDFTSEAKCSLARKQNMKATPRAWSNDDSRRPGSGAITPSEPTEPITRPDVPVQSQKPRRYHGTVVLDSARVGRDAGRIADEVLKGTREIRVILYAKDGPFLRNGVSERSFRFEDILAVQDDVIPLGLTCPSREQCTETES